MMSGLKRKLCAALLATAAGAAVAAAAAPAPPVPAGWIAFEDERGYRFCGVDQAESGTAASLGLALWDDGSAHLTVMDPAAPVVRKQKVALQLALDDGAPVAVEGTGVQPSAFRKGFSMTIDQALLAGVARARQLRLLREGREIARIDLAGSSAAIAGMRACFARVSAERAKLVAAPAPPVPPPPPNWPPPRKAPSDPVSISTYVGEDDYPALAMRSGAQGEVRLELEIDERGRVDQCAVVSSSGDAELDYGSCLVAERRFHFLPALDAEGKPVRGKTTRKLVWRLAD